MTVFLTQWLCPSRHASIVLAWEDTSTTEASVIERGEAVFASGAYNRHCGICGGGLQPETGRTRYPDIDSAYAELQRVQAANLASRRLLDSLGLTVEPGRGPLLTDQAN